MNFSVFCDKEKVFIQENFRFIPKITYFHLQNLYSHIFNRLSVVQYKDTIEFKSELRTHNLPTNTPSTTRFPVVFKSKNIIFLFVQKFIFLWETFLFFSEKLSPLSDFMDIDFWAATSICQNLYAYNQWKTLHMVPW